MINVAFSPSHKELAIATSDFLLSRPMVAAMLGFMKFACIMMCLGVGYAVYHKIATPKDLAFAITSLLWVFFYKPLNRLLVSFGMGKHAVKNIANQFTIDKKKISYTQRNSQHSVEWKKIRFILSNRDGYIIPLSGFINTGKFLWLPKRAFAADDEVQFLRLTGELQMKMKKAK